MGGGGGWGGVGGAIGASKRGGSGVEMLVAVLPVSPLILPLLPPLHPPPAERDEGEFARLSQLGDVLGLSQMDVYQVLQGAGRVCGGGWSPALCLS